MTRRRYVFSVPARHIVLPARLMIETMRRLKYPRDQALPSDPTVSSLGKAAWNDAGYCLDAPDILPAGSVYWASDLSDLGGGLALPSECKRENKLGGMER